jgi:2'-5' RNA ligase
MNATPMNATPKHALWLRPFGEAAYELEQHIKRLSLKYDTPSFEPHITLVSGLRRPQHELIQLTDVLGGAISPFTVELTRLGFSDHYYQSLFYLVKKTATFVSVHKTAGKFFGYHSNEKYFPHLSLMYGNLKQSEKEKLLHTIGQVEHVKFPVHSVLLIKTEGEIEDWEKIHTANFTHK